MSIEITRPVGEVFRCCKVKLQVVENKTCKDCFFNGNKCQENADENVGHCYAKYRDDRKNVIFKRIDK